AGWRALPWREGRRGFRPSPTPASARCRATNPGTPRRADRCRACARRDAGARSPRPAPMRRATEQPREGAPERRAIDASFASFGIGGLGHHPDDVASVGFQVALGGAADVLRRGRAHALKSLHRGPGIVETHGTLTDPLAPILDRLPVHEERHLELVLAALELLGAGRLRRGPLGGLDDLPL